MLLWLSRGEIRRNIAQGCSEIDRRVLGVGSRDGGKRAAEPFVGGGARSNALYTRPTRRRIPNNMRNANTKLAHTSGSSRDNCNKSMFVRDPLFLSLFNVSLYLFDYAGPLCLALVCETQLGFEGINVMLVV